MFIENRETHVLLAVPSHVTSCAAPSFYLQTLTCPYFLTPKTLFWSNTTKVSHQTCTLFQQQTLLITCNMLGQQIMGTVSYCWVKTVYLHLPDSFTWGVLPVRNTIWNQNTLQKYAHFRGAETENRQFSCSPSPSAALALREGGTGASWSLTCSSPT